jgi:hypothetical protein
MKKCSKCKKDKQIQLFGKSSRNKDGLMVERKECHNEYKNAYRQRNPQILKKINSTFYKTHRELVLDTNRRWRENNAEVYKASSKNSRQKRKLYYSEYNKQYREKNKEYLNTKTREWYAANRVETIKKKGIYTKKKLKTDINFRISKSFRDRMSKALKNNQKNGSAVKDLGCSIKEFKLYIESKFDNKMNWSNYGFGYGKWQLDHTIPLYSFDLSDREQFLKACNFTNIQPLWYKDHIEKTTRDLSEY